MNMPLKVCVSAFMASAEYKKAFGTSTSTWSAMAPNVLDQFCANNGVTLTPDEKLKVLMRANRKQQGLDDAGSSESSTLGRNLF